MDCRRDGEARRCRMSLDMKSCHCKVSHAPTCAGAWKGSCWRRAACGGAWGAFFRRGFLRRVDWPRAPQNMRFPAEEEFSGKVAGGSGEEIRQRRVLEGE